MTDERGTLHPKIAQTAGARLFKVSFTSFRRPYLTGRATIGRLELPPGEGRFVCEPPT